MENIIVIDFSGTLIKPFVAEEANRKRYEQLGLKKLPASKEKKAHGTKEHYAQLRKHIAKKFGITEQMKILMAQNYGGDIWLSGKDIQTIIMTDLFRDCMYEIVANQGRTIYTDGMLTALQAIKKKGYRLAIVSGIRKDIIMGILNITKCPVVFDHIYGQDPVLSRDDNQYLNQQLAKHGKICFIIGDKLADLKPAKKLKATSIFLKGGHPTGGEEIYADYTVTSAKDILSVIH